MSSRESLPSETIRPGAAPASPRTLDTGKIRTGAGCRIRLLSQRTADTGKIRTGAGCRIRLLNAG